MPPRPENSFIFHELVTTVNSPHYETYFKKHSLWKYAHAEETKKKKRCDMALSAASQIFSVVITTRNQDRRTCERVTRSGPSTATTDTTAATTNAQTTRTTTAHVFAADGAL